MLAWRLTWPVAASLLVLIPAQQPQPPQQPTFRTGVESVPIYATVLDETNHVVRNLGRNDFQVYDDGRRQELTTFENVFQPITAILLVDTSASMTLTLDLARHAAEQFVVRMSPGDKVRVGSFSDRLSLSDGFTDDRDRLLRYLKDDLRIGNVTQLWDGLDEAIAALADQGGRRVIVAITDGEDTYRPMAPHDMMERAKAAGVMLYLVQIRSRSQPGMEKSIAGPTRPGFSSIPRVTMTPTQILRELAGNSGGVHFMLNHRDNVSATFTQVAFELHYQYVLAFTPRRLDGKLHQIEVRTRDPRWSVRARRYYQAAKEPQR
jgi:VWFA-related protein